jgi:hypothetical protein
MSLENLLAWTRDAIAWLPNWAISAVCLLLAAGLAIALHGAAMRLLRRLVPPSFDFLQSLISATHSLIRVGLVVIAIGIVLPLVPLGREARSVVGHGLMLPSSCCWAGAARPPSPSPRTTTSAARASI